MFGRRYSLWRAGLPVDFGPVLTFEGKCSHLRAKLAHLAGHLPTGPRYSGKGILGSRLNLREGER